MMNGNVTMKIRPGRLVCSCKRNKNMMFWNDLIPFVQLQNREKHPWRSDVILQAFSNIPSRKKMIIYFLLAFHLTAFLSKFSH